MENNTTKAISYGDRVRKKRARQNKTIIIVGISVCLLLPIILCIILFFKVNALQKQLNILMLDQKSTTYEEKSSLFGRRELKEEVTASFGFYSEPIFSFQKDLYYKKSYYNNLYNKLEDYTSSLEESDKNGYNEVEALTGDTDNSKDVSKTLIDTANDLTKENKKNNDGNEFSDKKVYLTFDDGPSIYTEDILEILDKYGVKATFFVIGKTDDHSKRMYKRIVDEGHSLGLHSYSHDYNIIYNSLGDFKKDFMELSNLLYDSTGYRSTIFRFPGGSSNPAGRKTVSAIIDYLSEESIVYFDWNVVNGDATGKELTAAELYNNVMEGIKSHTSSIVLMHDTGTKKSTVESLNRLLKELTEKGVQLLPLHDEVTPVQQVKAGAE
ncbi:hypothetical protein acsn021_30040 [Anaerocolumna cellulosilytica]|uniref:Uncharacterized protein n=1 Tax=Anaerocolumna cellulosilytica TaxID=433286 RepID=A0A6S6R8A9_9FIRM|nr:polysaccharide deacetylase family protein [Anaerocolumna cellulosilytica]MBB5197418.1 peptidoglycan/xylan/chitin deacetylase (PgdA/CDA1 family) [Anaerocolumna cellulosilytica]BCJ95435.1 hypothetical protein acsn021_30040 [Anaerocolumna cellulosilytica]